MKAPRVSDNEVARIVARTPVEFECDASAFENLALDLRDARAEVSRLKAEKKASRAARRDAR